MPERKIGEIGSSIVTMPKRQGQCDAAKQGWNTGRAKLNASDSSLDTPNCNKRHKFYDQKAMISDMEAVKSGEMGVNRAALKHGIPKTTLKDRISGRVKHGKNPVPN